MYFMRIIYIICFQFNVNCKILFYFVNVNELVGELLEINVLMYCNDFLDVCEQYILKDVL